MKLLCAIAISTLFLPELTYAEERPPAGKTTDHDGQLIDRHVGVNTNFTLESGDSGGVWANRFWEFLEADWGMREGLIIPADQGRSGESTH